MIKQKYCQEIKRIIVISNNYGHLNYIITAISSFQSTRSPTGGFIEQLTTVPTLANGAWSLLEANIIDINPGNYIGQIKFLTIPIIEVTNYQLMQE